jgi:hypothetical protein
LLKSITFNLEHPENKLFILFKDVVSISDKSNDSKEIQFSNNDSNEVICELRIFGSFIDSKELKPLNKPSILFNEEPKFVKSIYFKDVKPLNKFSAEVILDESNFEKSIDTILFIFSSFKKNYQYFPKEKQTLLPIFHLDLQ